MCALCVRELVFAKWLRAARGGIVWVCGEFLSLALQAQPVGQPR